MINELTSASKYEQLLQQEYDKLKKNIIPRAAELPTETDAQILEINLAKNKALEIASPSLADQIVNDLKMVESEILNYVKYADLFKAALGGKKLQSIQQFRDNWDLFKKQEIGKKLEIVPEVVINPEEIILTGTIAGLQSASTESLDRTFRNAIKKMTGKDVANVNIIEYPKYNGDMSVMTLKNKDSIITFDPIPTDPKVKDIMTRVNNVKIRYIYYSQDPKDKKRKKNVKVQWVGSSSSSSAPTATADISALFTTPAAEPTASGSAPASTPAVAPTTTGSGLRSNSLRYFKKKMGSTLR